MTGPDVYPLVNAGDAITLRVASCEPMKIGTYPEIEFIGDDAAGRRHAVRIPKSSVERQFKRADLTPTTIVGRTIVFSRDANRNDPKKPFWGITLADAPIAAAAKAVTSSAATPAPETVQPGTTQAREKASELYRNVTRYALDTILPMYAEKGLTPTATDIKEIVAAVFIAANR